MDAYLIAQHADLAETHWWLVARRRIIVDILDRRVRELAHVDRLLDVGCGPGMMVPALTRYGSVTVVDASAAAVEHVRRRYPDVAAVAGELPDVVGAIDGGFDVVTALDVIEHIPDDEGALRSIRQAMAPGALLLCTVPALQLLWGPHDELNGHQRRYTRRRLVRTLEAAGFDVAWASYFNTFLFPPVAAVRLTRRLLRRPGEAASDLDTEAGPLNGVLERVFAAERHVLRRMRLPVGVSLVAVAHRPVSG